MVEVPDDLVVVDLEEVLGVLEAVGVVLAAGLEEGLGVDLEADLGALEEDLGALEVDLEVLEVGLEVALVVGLEVALVVELEAVMVVFWMLMRRPRCRASIPGWPATWIRYRLWRMPMLTWRERSESGTTSRDPRSNKRIIPPTMIQLKISRIR